MSNHWVKVVFAADCHINEDEDFICHQCGNEYADCPCPGPTMDDEYEYKEEGGELYARKLLGGE